VTMWVICAQADLLGLRDGSTVIIRVVDDYLAISTKQ
jgi:hypothetical protein